MFRLPLEAQVMPGIAVDINGVAPIPPLWQSVGFYQCDTGGFIAGE
jgi:hypothetical protein